MSRKKETWSERIANAKPQYFWWGLVNILCICLALISWVFIPQVFENPHKAKNYKILEKIGRLPQVKAFSALDTPEGEIGTFKNLYSNFVAFESDKLVELNQRLLKNYIGNFKYDYPNIYIKGDFRVIKCRALNESDVFTKGIAIQAAAFTKGSVTGNEKSYPVWIEIILPNAPAEAAQHTKRGDLLEINKNPYFASILHVQRLDREDNDPIMRFTVIPLVYESAWDPAHGPKFSISPVEKLNLEARLPIKL